MSELFNFLKPLSDRTTPRWIILLIDMLIVAVSYSLVLLSGAFPNTFESGFDVTRNFCLLLGVFFVVSFFSKSYAYVIRLTALNDLFRTMVLCLGSLAILIAINVVAQQITSVPFFSMWGLGFAVLLSFCLMTAERLTIKYIYTKLLNFRNLRKRALIVGKSLNSLFIANMLQNEINGKYMPVALLTFNNDNTTKTYKNNFPVYTFEPETFDLLVQQLRVSVLIISSNDISMLNSEVAKPILNTGIKVLSVNHLDKVDLNDIEQEQAESNKLSSSIKEVRIEDLLGRAPIITDNSLVRQNIYNQTILITGACGSIGSEIVRQVAACKAKTIVCVDQAETPMHDLILEMKDSAPDINIVPYMASVTNIERMDRAFATYKPKIVIHAAAYKHVPMMEIN
ncbi:MAG: polysaccharide biosynthesis protein, partial [Muribaculaceae bacterium]